MDGGDTNCSVIDSRVSDVENFPLLTIESTVLIQIVEVFVGVELMVKPAYNYTPVVGWIGGSFCVEGASRLGCRSECHCSYDVYNPRQKPASNGGRRSLC